MGDGDAFWPARGAGGEHDVGGSGGGDVDGEIVRWMVAEVLEGEIVEEEDGGYRREGRGEVAG